MKDRLTGLSGSGGSMEGAEIKEEIDEEIRGENPPMLNREHDSKSSRQTEYYYYVPATKHAIFLSHSGAQKDFTEQLCEELDRRNLFPFFDKRSTSLPKGESFPPLIFSAARQCRLAVLVLSHDYFTRSKWPMMELVTFIEAKKSGINPGLKLLPLYFRISRHEIKEALRNKRWQATWEEWRKEDPRIEVEKWHQGLAALGSENGLAFEEFRGEVAYRKAVVDAVQFWIPPSLKFDDSQIHGKHRLCKVISEVLDESPGNPTSARVVGMYGAGGSGKTTLCKALCNYYQVEFRGKVCFLEFGKQQSQVDLQKKVLIELTETSEAVVQQISDPDQGQQLLMERLHKHKVFLTLDNVNDTQEMTENARMFLRAGFHPESKVLVTARSRKVLEQVMGGQVASVPVPKLTQEEAICLFLQHATYQNSTFGSFSSECQDVIVRCVERCFQGHPLTLKALGARLRIICDTDPLQWSEHLEDLDFKMSHDRVHPLFSILRTGYDALPEGHKFVFIDIALYAPQGVLWSVGQLCCWLGYMHNKTPHTIKEMLMGMRAKTLIDDWVDMDSVVTMHDLYKELAEIEVKEGSFKNSCIYESETPNALTKAATPQPRLELLRVKLLPGSSDTLPKEVMESLLNVEVFSLKGCDRLRKLDLRGFRNLRSLSLQNCDNIDEVRYAPPKTGLLTSMLRSVIPKEVQTLSVSYLRFLNLEHCKGLTRAPDLTGCVNLRELNVVKCENLVTPPKLTSCSQLRELKILECKHLREPPKLDNCTELVEFHMWELENLQDMPRLHQSTALKFVSLHGCKKVKKIHDLEHLTNLVDLGIIGTSIKYKDLVSKLNPLKNLKKIRCEIYQATGDLEDNVIDLQDVKLTTKQLKLDLDLTQWSFLKRVTIYPNELDEVIDLSMFFKLETIFISSNKSFKMRELRGLDKMPRLEKVFLSECAWLTVVPDLSGLTELKVVNLYNCEDVEDSLRLPKQCKLHKVNWIPS